MDKEENDSLPDNDKSDDEVPLVKFKSHHKRGSFKSTTCGFYIIYIQILNLFFGILEDLPMQSLNIC